MLLGLNEELERVMGEYRRNRNGTEKKQCFQYDCNEPGGGR